MHSPLSFSSPPQGSTCSGSSKKETWLVRRLLTLVLPDGLLTVILAISGREIFRGHLNTERFRSSGNNLNFSCHVLSERCTRRTYPFSQMSPASGNNMEGTKMDKAMWTRMETTEHRTASWNMALLLQNRVVRVSGADDEGVCGLCDLLGITIDGDSALSLL